MEGRLDFANRPIAGLIWALFIPTVVAMLFDAGFLIVDGIFIGRGIGPDGLASVNLFGPLFVLYIGIGAMIGAGCSIKVAMEMSNGKLDSAREIVTTAYILCGVICAVSAAILYLFPHAILTLVGTTPTLEPLATEYYLWIIPSACFTAIQITASFIIRLDGSPKYVMVATITATAINIVLDYLFIMRLHMGMMGAALATNIGIGIGVLMMIYYMLFLSKDLRFKSPVRITGTGRIFVLGSPSFLNEISLGAITLFGNIMFGLYLRDAGIAAFGIICYLTPIIYTVFISLSASMQPIVSYNCGCRNIIRVKKTFKICIVISTVYAAISGAIVLFFSNQIASIFLEPGIEAHNLASTGLKLFSIAYFFSGNNIIIITFLQSIEKTGQSMLLTILRSFVLVAFAFIIAPQIFGHSGLWLAVPIVEIISFALCIFILFLNFKKHHEF